MKLRKMMLNINGVDRMFMCDPENDKLSDVLRRIGRIYYQLAFFTPGI